MMLGVVRWKHLRDVEMDTEKDDPDGKWEMYHSHPRPSPTEEGALGHPSTTPAREKEKVPQSRGPPAVGEPHSEGRG